MTALAPRCEVGGGARQHPVSTTAARGALMASLAEAEREPVDSDEHARSTCGVLDLRRQPVRRSVWHWTVAGGRRRWLLVAIGRRRGSAPRRR